jgi:hypothetical protein
MLFTGFSGLAHWMFAHEYMQSARTMPFVLEDLPVPEAYIKFDRIVNIVMTSMMVGIHIIFSFCYYEENKAYFQNSYPASWAVLYNLLWGIFGLQVFIACIYLLLAV